MVGGAAQHDRQARPQQPGIQHLEQPGIFQREQGRQQALLRMVDHQPRLEAGEILRRAQEARRRHAQLLRIGNVLGVEDREQRAAGPRSRRGSAPAAWSAVRRAARS
jgi:hypothetical protein